MKTKKEQIEEMAVIGCVRNPQAHTAEECSKCDFKQGMCNSYRHAEALYDAGYRKVLFDTENGKAVDVAQYAPWKLVDGYTEREVEKVRKETAKEIKQAKLNLLNFSKKRLLPHGKSDVVFPEMIDDIIAEVERQ